MYKAALVQLRAVVRRHGLSDKISMVRTAREGTFFFFSFEGKNGSESVDIQRHPSVSNPSTCLAIV